MKKLIYIFLAMALFTGVTTVHAQSTFSMQYSIGFGSGDLKTYNTTTSFRGFTMEWRKMIQPNLGIGLDGGWNVFYERHAYDTYTSGSVSLSGVQYRYTNAVPLLIAADYYLKPGEKFNPFFGFGVGTLYAHRRTDMGIWTTSEEDWQFAIKPEVGVLVNLTPETDLTLGLKYYTGFATKDMNAQSYFAFNIGFVFKRHM